MLSSRNSYGPSSTAKGKQNNEPIKVQDLHVQFRSETSAKKEEDISFAWKIRDLDSFGSDEIQSECYRSLASGNQWILKIQKVNDIDDDIDYLSVILEMVNEKSESRDPGTFNASIELTLIGTTQQVLMNRVGFGKVTPLDFMWKFPRFIKISALKEPKFGYMKEGNLEIFCRVFTGAGIQHSKIEKFGLPYSSDGVDKLLGSMKELLLSGDDSDVTITTLTKLFPVHKCILKSRSPVFKTMLESQMVEAANSVINIVDFKEEAVSGMLSYMYTGKVENMSDHAVEMLRIADKYDMEGLKAEAEVSMMENLNIENAAEFLMQADLFNTTRLKSKIVKFMKQFKKDIEKTEGFRKIVAKYPMLLIFY